MKLILGAGNRPVVGEGIINHDIIKHRKEIDIIWDLNDLPWPWETEQFDYIKAFAVFEHLDNDLIKTINECWRIMKYDGILDILLPLWNHPNGFRDPTHRWQFTEGSLDFFDPTTEVGKEYGFYTPYKWQVFDKIKYNVVDGKNSSFARQMRKISHE